MRQRMQRFMYGRYGADDLGKFLNIVILILLMLGILFEPQISSLALALLVCQFFRMFSRNTSKRAEENNAYLRVRRRITGWFSTRRQRFAQRKTHRFYRCPSCRQTLRVPKGKGKLSLTCPKCQTNFVKKS